MKKSILTLFFILTGILSTHAQFSDDITIPLESRSDQWVKVDVKYGPVTVRGTDRNDVYIKWEQMETGSKNSRERADGLKRISSGESNLEILQEGNVIRVDASSYTSGYVIYVEVPTKMNIDISSFNNGDIAASNIEGIISLETYNGKINADSIRGSVVASTQNGEIIVGFDEVTRDKPMHFITYNGNVDITLPGDTEATFKMHTRGGEILTAFDLALKDAKDMSKQKKMPGKEGQKVFIDGWLYADLNGGGPIFELENNWGDILIRRGD